MKSFTWTIAAAAIALGGPVLAQGRDRVVSAEEAVAATEAAEEAAEEQFYPDYPQPLTDAWQWVKNADYPLEAWRAGMEGEVEYSLSVDARGMVTGCDIVSGSGHALLDRTTCKLLRERAEFEPARDENGNPIPSSFAGYASWQKRDPEFSQSFVVKVRYTVNERGEGVDCEVLEISDQLPENIRASFEREPCPVGATAGSVPYRDANGVPVAKEVTLLLQIGVQDAGN